MQKQFKKIMAAALAVTMAVTGYPSVPAQASPGAALGVSADFPADLSRLEIPGRLGRIQEAYLRDRSRTVLLIQDAHAVPEAARSIAGLIHFFEKEYGISLVTFEGAKGRLDAAMFRSFPDKALLKKVFKQIHDRGELAGVSAAVLFGDRPGTLFEGLEDWPVYEEGYRYFQEALRQEKPLTQKIKALQAELARKKQTAYSPQALEFDRATESFYTDKINLPELLKVLRRFNVPAQSAGLQALLDEIKMSETAQGDLSREAAVVADQYFKSSGGHFDQRAAAEFNRKRQALQTGELSPGAFMHFLRPLAKTHGVRLKLSPALRGAAKNERKLRDLEGTQFMRDLEQWLAEIKKLLLKTEAERGLDAESRRLFLLKKLAGLELSYAEWHAMNSLLADSPKPLDLSRQFSAHLTFYRNAEKRDGVLFKNLTQLMKKHPVKNTGASFSEKAIIVAGGFHAQGLTQHFRESGISYLVITPSIRELPEKSNYKAQMQGRVSWQSYFKAGADGRVNLYEAFIRYARDELLSANLSTLKFWRDQIIRDLADQGRAGEASRYTYFLDELHPDSAESGSVFYPLSTDFLKRLRGFIDGLRGLKETNRINEQNILNLLSAHTMGVAAVNGQLASKLTLPARMMGLEARSEMPLGGSLETTRVSAEPRSEMRTDSHDSVQQNSPELDVPEMRRSILQEIGVRFGLPAAALGFGVLATFLTKGIENLPASAAAMRGMQFALGSVTALVMVSSANFMGQWRMGGLQPSWKRALRFAGIIQIAFLFWFFMKPLLRIYLSDFGPAAMIAVDTLLSLVLSRFMSYLIFKAEKQPPEEIRKNMREKFWLGYGLNSAIWGVFNAGIYSIPKDWAWTIPIASDTVGFFMGVTFAGYLYRESVKGRMPAIWRGLGMLTPAVSGAVAGFYLLGPAFGAPFGILSGGLLGILWSFLIARPYVLQTLEEIPGAKPLPVSRAGKLAAEAPDGFLRLLSEKKIRLILDPKKLRRLWIVPSLWPWRKTELEQAGRGNFAQVFVYPGHRGAVKVARDLSFHLWAERDRLQEIKNILPGLVRSGAIPEVVQQGFLGKVFYLVLNGPADAENLAQLEKSPQILFLRRLQIILETGLILQEINQAGWIHNDVKAQNILVGENGQGSVQVIDFGVAMPASHGDLKDLIDLLSAAKLFLASAPDFQVNEDEMTRFSNTQTWDEFMHTLESWRTRYGPGPSRSEMPSTRSELRTSRVSPSSARSEMRVFERRVVFELPESGMRPSRIQGERYVTEARMMHVTNRNQQRFLEDALGPHWRDEIGEHPPLFIFFQVRGSESRPLAIFALRLKGGVIKIPLVDILNQNFVPGEADWGPAFGALQHEILREGVFDYEMSDWQSEKIRLLRMTNRTHPGRLTVHPIFYHSVMMSETEKEPRRPVLSIDYLPRVVSSQSGRERFVQWYGGFDRESFARSLITPESDRYGMWHGRGHLAWFGDRVFARELGGSATPFEIRPFKAEPQRYARPPVAVQDVLNTFFEATSALTAHANKKKMRRTEEGHLPAWLFWRVEAHFRPSREGTRGVYEIDLTVHDPLREAAYGYRVFMARKTVERRGVKKQKEIVRAYEHPSPKSPLVIPVEDEEKARFIIDLARMTMALDQQWNENGFLTGTPHRDHFRESVRDWLRASRSEMRPGGQRHSHFLHQGKLTRQSFDTLRRAFERKEVTARYRERVMAALTEVAKRAYLSEEKQALFEKRMGEIKRKDFKIYSIPPQSLGPEDYLEGLYDDAQHKLYISQDYLAYLEDRGPPVEDYERKLFHEVMYPARKVLVLGASGFLGKEIHQALSWVYPDVTGTAHTQTRDGLIPVDVTREADIVKLIKEEKPDAIIYAAGVADLQQAENDREQAARLNTEVPEMLARHFKGQLIYLSTDYVFDGKAPPYEPSAQAAPLNFYGETKIKGEQAVLEHAQNTVIRFGLVYGADHLTLRDPLQQFVLHMEGFQQGDAPLVLDDTQIRHPVWIHDIANLAVNSVNERQQGVLQINGAEGMTKLQFAQEIEKAYREAAAQEGMKSEPPPAGPFWAAPAAPQGGIARPQNAQMQNTVVPTPLSDAVSSMVSRHGGLTPRHAHQALLTGDVKTFNRLTQALTRKGVRWVITGAPEKLPPWQGTKPTVYRYADRGKIHEILTKGFEMTVISRIRSDRAIDAGILSSSGTEPRHFSGLATEGSLRDAAEPELQMLFSKEVQDTRKAPYFELGMLSSHPNANALIYLSLHGYNESMSGGVSRKIWVPLQAKEDLSVVSKELAGGSFSSVRRVMRPNGSTLIEKHAVIAEDGGKLRDEANYMRRLQETGDPAGSWFPRIFSVREEAGETRVEMEDIPWPSLSEVIHWSFPQNSFDFGGIKQSEVSNKTLLQVIQDIYRTLTPDFYAQKQSETPPDFLERYHFQKVEERWRKARTKSEFVRKLLAAPYLEFGDEAPSLMPNLGTMMKTLERVTAAHPKFFTPPYLSKQHGDLHAGNILVDPFDYVASGEIRHIKLVDPKYMPEGNDPLYDFAKLLHNYFGHYDLAIDHSQTFRFIVNMPEEANAPASFYTDLDDEASGTLMTLSRINLFNQELMDFLRSASADRLFPFEKDPIAWRMRLLFTHATLMAGLLPYHAASDAKISVIYERTAHLLYILLDALHAQGMLKKTTGLHKAWAALEKARVKNNRGNFEKALHQMDIVLARSEVRETGERPVSDLGTHPQVRAEMPRDGSRETSSGETRRSRSEMRTNIEAAILPFEAARQRAERIKAMGRQDFAALLAHVLKNDLNSMNLALQFFKIAAEKKVVVPDEKKSAKIHVLTHRAEKAADFLDEVTENLYYIGPQKDLGAISTRHSTPALGVVINDWTEQDWDSAKFTSSETEILNQQVSDLSVLVAALKTQFRSFYTRIPLADTQGGLTIDFEKLEPQYKKLETFVTEVIRALRDGNEPMRDVLTRLGADMALHASLAVARSEMRTDASAQSLSREAGERPTEVNNVFEVMWNSTEGHSFKQRVRLYAAKMAELFAQDESQVAAIKNDAARLRVFMLPQDATGWFLHKFTSWLRAEFLDLFDSPAPGNSAVTKPFTYWDILWTLLALVLSPIVLGGFTFFAAFRSLRKALSDPVKPTEARQLYDGVAFYTKAPTLRSITHELWHWLRSKEYIRSDVPLVVISNAYLDKGVTRFHGDAELAFQALKDMEGVLAPYLRQDLGQLSRAERTSRLLEYHDPDQVHWKLMGDFLNFFDVALQPSLESGPVAIPTWFFLRMNLFGNWDTLNLDSPEFQQVLQRLTEISMSLASSAVFGMSAESISMAVSAARDRLPPEHPASKRLPQLVETWLQRLQKPGIRMLFQEGARHPDGGQVEKSRSEMRPTVRRQDRQVQPVTPSSQLGSTQHYLAGAVLPNLSRVDLEKIKVEAGALAISSVGWVYSKLVQDVPDISLADGEGKIIDDVRELDPVTLKGLKWIILPANVQGYERVVDEIFEGLSPGGFLIYGHGEDLGVPQTVIRTATAAEKKRGVESVITQNWPDVNAGFVAYKKSSEEPKPALVIARSPARRGGQAGTTRQSHGAEIASSQKPLLAMTNEGVVATYESASRHPGGGQVEKSRSEMRTSENVAGSKNKAAAPGDKSPAEESDPSQLLQRGFTMAQQKIISETAEWLIRSFRLLDEAEDAPLSAAEREKMLQLADSVYALRMRDIPWRFGKIFASYFHFEKDLIKQNVKTPILRWVFLLLLTPLSAIESFLNEFRMVVFERASVFARHYIFVSGKAPERQFKAIILHEYAHRFEIELNKLGTNNGFVAIHLLESAGIPFQQEAMAQFFPDKALIAGMQDFKRGGMELAADNFFVNRSPEFIEDYLKTSKRVLFKERTQSPLAEKGIVRLQSGLLILKAWIRVLFDRKVKLIRSKELFRIREDYYAQAYLAGVAIALVAFAYPALPDRIKYRLTKRFLALSTNLGPILAWHELKKEQERTERGIPANAGFELVLKWVALYGKFLKEFGGTIPAVELFSKLASLHDVVHDAKDLDDALEKGNQWIQQNRGQDAFSNAWRLTRVQTPDGKKLEYFSLAIQKSPDQSFFEIATLRPGKEGKEGARHPDGGQVDKARSETRALIKDGKLLAEAPGGFLRLLKEQKIRLLYDAREAALRVVPDYLGWPLLPAWFVPKVELKLAGPGLRNRPRRIFVMPGQRGSIKISEASIDAVNTGRPDQFEFEKSALQTLAGLVPDLMRDNEIPSVVESGILDGWPYMVLDTPADAVDLMNLQNDKNISFQRRLEILIKVGRILQKLNQAGWIHRDVKHENILVGDGGRGGVQLIDFGIALPAASVAVELHAQDIRKLAWAAEYFLTDITMTESLAPESVKREEIHALLEIRNWDELLGRLESWQARSEMLPVSLRVFNDGDGHYGVSNFLVELSVAEQERLKNHFVDPATGHARAGTRQAELEEIVNAFEEYLTFPGWDLVPAPYNAATKPNADQGYKCSNCSDWARTLAVFVKFLENQGWLQFNQLYGYATTAELGHHIAVALSDAALITDPKSVETQAALIVMDAWFKDFKLPISMISLSDWNAQLLHANLYYEPTATAFYTSDEYTFENDAALTRNYINLLGRGYSGAQPRPASPIYDALRLLRAAPTMAAGTEVAAAEQLASVFVGAGFKPAQGTLVNPGRVINPPLQDTASITSPAAEPKGADNTGEARSEMRTKTPAANPMKKTMRAGSEAALQAWKQDWLAGDVLTDRLSITRNGVHSLAIHFLDAAGERVTKPTEGEPLKTYVTIVQEPDEPKHISLIGGSGYPGIAGKEVLRGLLRWLRSYGITQVQFKDTEYDETRPDDDTFMRRVFKDWDKTRRVKPETPVGTLLPGQNPPRTVFYLDRLNLEKMSELKEALQLAPALIKRDGLGKVVDASALILNESDRALLAKRLTIIYDAAFSPDKWHEAYRRPATWVHFLTSSEVKILVMADERGEVRGFLLSDNYETRSEAQLQLIASFPDPIQGKETLLMDAYLKRFSSARSEMRSKMWTDIVSVIEPQALLNKRSRSKIMSLPQILSGRNVWVSRLMALTISGMVGGWMWSQMIPEVLAGGYMTMFVKSLSRVIKILFSADANRMTLPFLIPLGTMTTSWVSWRNWTTSIRIFSSAKNRNLGGKGKGFFVVDEIGRIVERRAHLLYSQSREAFDNVLNAFAALKNLQGLRDKDSRSSEAGFSVANVGGGDNQTFHGKNLSTAKKLYQDGFRSIMRRTNARSEMRRKRSRDTSRVSAEPRSEMRLGEQPQYPQVVEVYDPKTYDVRLLINRNPSGKFRHNHLTGQTTWEGQAIKVSFEGGAGEGTGPINVPWHELERELGDRYPEADVYSYHNLFYVDWFAAFEGATGKLLYHRGEPFEAREYSMFVVWKDKTRGVTSETFKFKQVPGLESGKVRIYKTSDAGEQEDLSGEIEFAFFGQRVIHEGQTVPFASIAHQFDDIFQIYNFPQFIKLERDENGKIAKYDYGKIILGQKELAQWRDEEPAKFLDVVRNNGLMTLDLKPYLQLTSLEDLERNELQSAPKNYQKKQDKQPDQLGPGEYRIDGDALTIRLKPYPYPHNLVGITRSGKIIAMVITGEKFEGSGTSIQEMPANAQALYEKQTGQAGKDDPIQELFILANSQDALRRKIRDGQPGTFTETGSRHYERTTAALVLAKRSEMRSNFPRVDSAEAARKLLQAAPEVVLSDMILPARPGFHYRVVTGAEALESLLQSEAVGSGQLGRPAAWIGPKAAIHQITKAHQAASDFSLILEINAETADRYVPKAMVVPPRPSLAGQPAKHEYLKDRKGVRYLNRIPLQAIRRVWLVGKDMRALKITLRDKTQAAPPAEKPAAGIETPGGLQQTVQAALKDARMQGYLESEAYQNKTAEDRLAAIAGRMKRYGHVLMDRHLGHLYDALPVRLEFSAAKKDVQRVNLTMEEYETLRRITGESNLRKKLRQPAFQAQRRSERKEEFWRIISAKEPAFAEKPRSDLQSGLPAVIKALLRGETPALYSRSETRLSARVQNQVLKVLEVKRLLGVPLKMQTLVAWMEALRRGVRPEFNGEQAGGSEFLAGRIRSLGYELIDARGDLKENIRKATAFLQAHWPNETPRVLGRFGLSAPGGGVYAGKNYDGKLTLGNTTPTERSQSLDYEVLHYLLGTKQRGLARIVDLGVGYPPVTTIQTAKKTAGLAEVIGVDLNMPNYTIHFPNDYGYEYHVFFEKTSDNLDRVTFAVQQTDRRNDILIYNELDGEEREFVVAKALEHRKRLMEQLGPAGQLERIIFLQNAYDRHKGGVPLQQLGVTKKDFKELRDFYAKKAAADGKVRLTVEPVRRQSLKVKGLRFQKAGFELSGIDQVDIIRAANVFHYYDMREARSAIQSMGSKLKEGGILIIARNDDNSIVFKKQNGRLIPQVLTTRIRPYDLPGYDDKVFPELAQLFMDTASAISNSTSHQSFSGRTAEAGRALQAAGYQVETDLQEGFLRVQIDPSAFEWLTDISAKSEMRTMTSSSTMRQTGLPVRPGYLEDLYQLWDLMDDFEKEQGTLATASSFGLFGESSRTMLEEAVSHFLSWKLEASPEPFTFDFQPSYHLLEVGAGNGLTALSLGLMEDWSVDGIELDPERANRAEHFVRYAAERGFSYPNVRLQQGDFLQWNLRPYDLTYFYFSPPLDPATHRLRSDLSLHFTRRVLDRLNDELVSGSAFISPAFGLGLDRETVNALLAEYPDLEAARIVLEQQAAVRITRRMEKRSEMRNSAEIFVRALAAGEINPEKAKRAAAEVAQPDALDAVLTQLERIYQDFSDRLARGETTVRLGAESVNIQAVQSLIQVFHQRLAKKSFAPGRYAVTYLMPRNDNEAEVLGRVLAQFSGSLGQVIFSKSSPDQKVPAKLQKILRELGIMTSTTRGLQRAPEFASEQQVSGVAGSAAEVDALKPEERFVPVVSLDMESSDDPLMAELVLTLQTAAALLIASRVRQVGEIAEVRQAAVALLHEIFPEAVTEFLQPHGSGVALSGTALRSFITAWAAAEEFHQAA